MVTKGSMLSLPARPTWLVDVDSSEEFGNEEPSWEAFAFQAPFSHVREGWGVGSEQGHLCPGSRENSSGVTFVRTEMVIQGR